MFPHDISVVISNLACNIAGKIVIPFAIILANMDWEIPVQVIEILQSLSYGAGFTLAVVGLYDRYNKRKKKRDEKDI